MKKQTTLFALIALVSLGSATLVQADTLEFHPLADADILAGDSDFTSSPSAVSVPFHPLADADFLAGADSRDEGQSKSAVASPFHQLADADRLGSSASFTAESLTDD